MIRVTWRNQFGEHVSLTIEPAQLPTLRTGIRLLSGRVISEETLTA